MQSGHNVTAFFDGPSIPVFDFQECLTRKAFYSAAIRFIFAKKIMKRPFILIFCLLLVCCLGVVCLNAQTSPAAPKASLLLHMVTYENPPRSTVIGIRNNIWLVITYPNGLQEEYKEGKTAENEAMLVKKMNELSQKGWQLKHVAAAALDESYQLLCTRYVFEMPME